jgi:bifunctional DNA-binding transcriptional regulator/antitoxin component of YhaV-PrlF toxin-antitoxin module
MKFRATIQLNGKTATGIPIPARIIDELGSTKRPKVRVTIAGYSFRTSVGSMGGRFMLPVNAEVRAAAGLAAGDDVDVDLELDTEPLGIVMPSDLAAALAGESEARRYFDGLTDSQRKWIVKPIEDAKKPETRQRRVEKTVAMLREGRFR